MGKVVDLKADKFESMVRDVVDGYRDGRYSMFVMTYLDENADTETILSDEPSVVHIGALYESMSYIQMMRAGLLEPDYED